MSDLTERVRTRIFPALLTAAGVTMLAAGLLTYTTPVAAEPAATATPTPPATPIPTASPLLTLPPLGSGPPPSATPTADPDRVATRVRIAALDIDLPVIRGPDGYPVCDVAMYLKELRQPGQGAATYLYAHARDGMFLPLLETRERDQLGMVVEVWTSDDYRFLYEIVDVRRDQRDLNDALAARYGAALAPDVRGTTRDAGQDPGHRRTDLRGGSGPRRRAPQAEARGLRLDPVDPAEDDGRGGGQQQDHGDHAPEAQGGPPPTTAVASLIPKSPPIAPIPARMTVTPVSRFMITDRLLLIWVR